MTSRAQIWGVGRPQVVDNSNEKCEIPGSHYSKTIENSKLGFPGSKLKIDTNANFDTTRSRQPTTKGKPKCTKCIPKVYKVYPQSVQCVCPTCTRCILKCRVYPQSVQSVSPKCTKCTKCIPKTV